MLWAIELIRPDGSGEPFDADDRHAIPTGREMPPSLFVVQEAFKRGALLAAGPPNTLRFGPSLAIKRSNARGRDRYSRRSAHRVGWVGSVGISQHSATIRLVVDPFSYP